MTVGRKQVVFSFFFILGTIKTRACSYINPYRPIYRRQTIQKTSLCEVDAVPLRLTPCCRYRRMMATINAIFTGKQHSRPIIGRHAVE